MSGSLALCLGLVVADLAAWGWAALAFQDHPMLLGTAQLAWGLGLRRALDADHIAAIAGATRTLVQAGARPVGIGMFFALGHSSVVLLACAALPATTMAFAGSLEAVGAILFLLAMAVANAVILAQVWQALAAERAGQPMTGAELDRVQRGGCILAALFRLVGRSWHMAPLGFLFGLGVDTAACVALLGVSAVHAGSGLSPWSIMVLPVLFAAGMVLVDTLDGLLMVRACAWAFTNPARRLRYSLAITAVPVVAAAGVALASIAQLLSEQAGVLAALPAALEGGLDYAGMAMVAVFTALWLGAMAGSQLRSARRA
jgi:high-affinity nickel-transport protein